MEESMIEPLVVSQLLRGERPENMSFEEFKIKRKMINNFIEKRNRGYIFHKSKQGSNGVTYKKDK